MTGESNIATLKNTNNELYMVPGDACVIAAPWVQGACPTAITTDAQGDLLPLPMGWQSLGELDQKAGIKITPDKKTNDILGYGSIVPRGSVNTAMSVTAEFSIQEWTEIGAALYWDVDKASVTVDPTTGEWQIAKSATPEVNYYSLIIVGQDITSGQGYRFPYWIFPKAMVTKQSAQSLSMSEALLMPVTFTAYTDDTLGEFLITGAGGPGVQATNTAAGFVEGS
ncbi:phage tail tube protein [Tsukamurella soli]|uniref:Phage major tail protein, phi13 family n=1 Tax=Tsukamurella soli TaxID=644556 RepID=A0ABP8K2F6_9ACTN